MTVFKDGSRTVAALDAEARTILARLELLSGAATQSFDSSGGHSSEDPGGKRPGGDSTTPADYYRRRLAGVYVTHGRKLEQALDDHAHDLAKTWLTQRLEEILDKATKELAQITGRDGEEPHRHDAALDTDDGIADTVADEARGKPARAVAERLGLGIFTVVRIYNDLGLDTLDGSDINQGVESTPQRARRYAQEGKTQKQIAALLGCSQPTVSRYLRSAA